MVRRRNRGTCYWRELAVDRGGEAAATAWGDLLREGFTIDRVVTPVLSIPRCDCLGETYLVREEVTVN